MKTVFTQDWKDWIHTNVNAGRDRDGIFKILLDEGYDFTSIVEQMGYRPSRPPWELVNPLKAQAAQDKKPAQATQPNKRRSQKTKVQSFTGNNGLPIAPQDTFVPNAIAFESSDIDLRTVDNVFSAEECQKIIDRIKPKLRPSSVSDFKVDMSVRTSKTCDLGVLDDPFIKDIDARICQLVGIDPAYSEVLQGQYYEVGQEFKAHTDYFDSHEFEQHCSQRGQRTFTVMIYLNDVEQGGETRFQRIGKEFKPVTGQAVIWNSLNPDGTPNPYSLHQAKPVEKGFKAVITKWFRTSCPNAESIPMMNRTINEFVPNYTQDGIFKTKLPEDLFSKVNKFYHDNLTSIQDEHVEGGFIFSSKDPKQRARPSSSVVEMTPKLRQEIHDTLKPLMEEWCGEALEPTFVYGIREYHNAAVLKMHRDRIDTHIISAIINVDQDTDVDWPLVIEDNYYRTHHVLLAPGDVVFYEGGRLLHGRPIAFEGRAFANVFCHFKPAGYEAPQMA